MANKQLVRTLGLTQILMLGISGTMGAGVFLLTGHAAGIVGPAVILVFLLAALQSLPNSLSYAELAKAIKPISSPCRLDAYLPAAESWSEDENASTRTGRASLASPLPPEPI